MFWCLYWAGEGIVKSFGIGNGDFGVVHFAAHEDHQQGVSASMDGSKEKF
jgi:hypothetical protein